MSGVGMDAFPSNGVKVAMSFAAELTYTRSRLFDKAVLSQGCFLLLVEQTVEMEKTKVL